MEIGRVSLKLRFDPMLFGLWIERHAAFEINESLEFRGPLSSLPPMLER